MPKVVVAASVVSALFGLVFIGIVNGLSPSSPIKRKHFLQPRTVLKISIFKLVGKPQCQPQFFSYLIWNMLTDTKFVSTTAWLAFWYLTTFALPSLSFNIHPQSTVNLSCIKQTTFQLGNFLINHKRVQENQLLYQKRTISLHCRPTVNFLCLD